MNSLVLIFLCGLLALGSGQTCTANSDCVTAQGSNYCCGFEYIVTPSSNSDSGFTYTIGTSECFNFVTSSSISYQSNEYPMSQYCVASNTTCATDTDCDPDGTGDYVCRLLVAQTDNSINSAQCVSSYLSTTPSVIYLDENLYNVEAIDQVECTSTSSCSGYVYPSLFYSYDYCCGSITLTSPTGTQRAYTCMDALQDGTT